MKNFIVIFAIIIAFALCFAQADSLNMRLVGEWTAPELLDSPYGNLHVDSIYVFIAGSWVGHYQGLYVLDVSTPTSIDSVTTIGDTVGTDFAIVDDSLLYIGGSITEIYNISQISSPTFLAQFAVYDSVGAALAILHWNGDSLIYGGIDDKLMTVNISNRTSPYVQAFTDGGPAGFWSSQNSGCISFYYPYAYLVGYYWREVGHDYYSVAAIRQFDISDPDTIVFLRQWYTDLILPGTETGAGIYAMQLEDTNYVYFYTNGGIFVLDTTLNYITELTRYGHSAEQCGNYLFVAERPHPDSIYTYRSIWDISNPLSPEQVAYYRDGTTSGLIRYKDGYLYECHQTGFRIYQWTDTTAVSQTNCRLDKNEELFISPNPVYYSSKVKLNLQVEDCALFDINGRKIKKVNKRIIDTDNISPGLYLVRGRYQNQTVMGKLLILR